MATETDMERNKENPNLSVSGILHLLQEIGRRFQHAALRSIGLTPKDREDVVASMFLRRRRDAVTYWLQLLLAMGIATVGLIINSSAVVIAAMLVAPLMAPVVELGMALVLGSPLLTIRSSLRVGGSVLAVIGGAALMTVALPFHEVTTEIASRTSPTALDLLLAFFVAIAAAFTTVRSTSETTSAAAGTSIGIALVPPLCVIGFGVGIQDADVAGGAFLLFVANLTAILFISVIAFWSLGFDKVEFAQWEAEALRGAKPDGWFHRTTHRLEKLFASRYGHGFRAAIPLLLVSAVIVPLSTALDQVAWQVKARSSVTQILNEALSSKNAVQSTVSVQHGVISTSLYLMGSPEEANFLEQNLSTKIAAKTGVVPSVRVVAVPDLKALKQTSAQEINQTVHPAAHLSAVQKQLAADLEAVWPQALGEILHWNIRWSETAEPTLVITHLGIPAGTVVEEMLVKSLSTRIGSTVQVRTRAIPQETRVRAQQIGQQIHSLTAALDAIKQNPTIQLCITTPSSKALARDQTGRQLATWLSDTLQSESSQATIRSGDSDWVIQIQKSPCES